MTIAAWKPRPQSSRVGENEANKFSSALRPETKDGGTANRTRDQLPNAAPIDGAYAHAILFGRFCLLLDRRELLADGLPVSLGNRALDVLIVLIEARGKLVTKDALLSRVWPNTTVEENNLQLQISTLRKALGKDRNLIQTDSGRGYRFTAAVAMGSPTPPAGEWAGASDQLATPIAELRGPPGNLPACTSGLVGRETQLSDIGDRVAANRLVTLVGAGGVGKTRLGLELARRLLPKFPDGVWVAELGTLSDPDLVPLAVAAALGLTDLGDSPNRLAAALCTKRLLLVLDNCAHVIGAAAGLAEAFLRASASLHVIATSREPLRVDGEWVYRVPPLEAPPAGTDDIEEVLRYSAAQLFVLRTCAAEPSIQFNARTAAATARICRRLDGLPLAIELAAANAAALGVEAVAAQLDQRFSMLTDGRRTAPARQQSLRATLDWSYALLPEAERAVMRRLSVLCGAFTINAASAIAASDGMAVPDVVRCLASLVTKSLVALEVAGPVARLRLFETVRVYAMDKLTESGELESVMRRLAALGTDCHAAREAIERRFSGRRTAAACGCSTLNSVHADQDVEALCPWMARDEQRLPTELRSSHKNSAAPQGLLCRFADR